MKNSLRLLASLGAMILLGACDPESPAGDVVREGYRPVYLSRAALQEVISAAPRELKDAGKIYALGEYVFVNEINQGIHVINNQNPANPRNVAFIRIPGNVDIAVKGNVLYADNGPDLVALDIRNPTDVKVLKRISNVFPNQMYPPQTGVSFDCVDNSRGVVIGWEKATLTNPKCRR
ncbi:MAG: hypothetical protein H7Z75_01135 [Ferruginibacter sp.]|nr:hypothetical protein [Cytophagales bacterium]